jgi:hypothetical protein
MPMKKISIDQVKKIAKQYGLKPSRVKGTDVVNIRKNPSDRYEDITWDEFESSLKKRGLAVFKTAESDFLKIMKDE